ncbi:MAG: tetratricopeptide repeat protein [Terracidiphilus sp.]
MKFTAYQAAPAPKNRRFCLRGAAWLMLLAVVPATHFAANAQTSERHSPPVHKPRPDQNVLESRIAAAEAARDSGDPEATEAANRLVIAAALRETADLKLLLSDVPKAIELYRASLPFEDRPATNAAIAFAELQAHDLDLAIQFAEQAHAADPANIRADRVLASAYDQKGEYAKAVEPFSRVAHAEPTVDDLYPLAVCLLQTKKSEDKQRAAAVFEQMKHVAGDSGSLHVLIGRAYRDGGDMQTAIREFQRAISLDPRTPHAHYFLGLARLFLNDWKPTPDAEAELRKEAEYFPEDYLANYMLGMITSGERKYDESDKYLLNASKINPGNPDPFLYLGMNAYAEDKLDRAEAMMRKAIELTGSDEARTNYQIRRAYVDLARILARNGHKEESDAFAAKARDLQNKTMVESQQSVSAALLQGKTGSLAAVVPLSPQQEKEAAPAVKDNDDPYARGKLTPEQRAAAEARERALRSVLALAFNDLATSQAIRKQYSPALDSYRQAEQWDPALQGLEKNLGQCAFKAKDYAEAIHGLSQALPFEPGSLALRAMLGISYFASDQYADAAKTFAPLGPAGMQDSETGYAWAASLTHIGDMKQATEVLTAFDSQPRSNDTLLLIGQLWTEIGDYARATATLARALQSDPSLAKAHFYEGLAYIHWEHWPEAQKEFQAELSLNPGDPDAKYHLGFVYLQLSKTDDAAALFLEVVAAHPDYANAQYELGKILLDRGQTDDAVTHLEAAARFRPETDYMHYQLQAAYRKQGRSADADRELEIYKGLKAKSRERIADKMKQTP